MTTKSKSELTESLTLEIEYETEKYENLIKFINSDNFNDLSVPQKSLLLAQKQIMSQLIRVLSERLDLIKKGN